MILSTFTIWLLQVLATQCELIKDPSLKPADGFSADNDAEEIRRQMMMPLDAINRDDISKIFFHKAYDQRHKIDETYNEKFCQDEDAGKCPFHSALKDISTQALEGLYNDALISPPEILVLTVRDAVESGKGEVGAIEEVVCANDKEMKDKINETYISYYSISIEDDLKTFRKDDEEYQKVMLNYCWKGLSQGKKITPQDVEKEAQALRNIDCKADRDGFKKKLTKLLDRYSEPDLKQIFQKYRDDKDGINDAVDKAFEVKRVRRAYNTLVRYVEDTSKYYADQLYDTVDTSYTPAYSVGKINRIILTRCERDLLRILNKYKDIHDGKTFTNHLKPDFTLETCQKNDTWKAFDTFVANRKKNISDGAVI